MAQAANQNIESALLRHQKTVHDLKAALPGLDLKMTAADQTAYDTAINNALGHASANNFKDANLELKKAFETISNSFCAGIRAYLPAALAGQVPD